jgi:hypothetical protein
VPSKGVGLVYQEVHGINFLSKCLKIKPRTQFYQPEAPVEEEYVPAWQSAHADAPVPVPVRAANNLNGTSARPLAIRGVKCAAVAIASVQLGKSCMQEKHARTPISNRWQHVSCCQLHGSMRHDAKCQGCRKFTICHSDRILTHFCWNCSQAA